jgi:hypothetical protein
MSEQFCDTTTNSCKRKFSLDTICTEKGQCLPSNSECLEDAADSMKCKCVEMFTPARDQCVQACEDDSGCPSSASLFCHAIFKGCLPQIGLHDKCEADAGDTQCKTENSQCISDVCSCGAEFAEKNSMCIEKCDDTPTSCNPNEFCEGSSGLCNPKKFLGQPCSESKECLTENSACLSDKCECKSDEFLNYYGSCLQNCTKNLAACEVGTQYCSSVDNVCFRKANLHEGCSPSIEGTGQCMIPNAVCSAQTSTCECGDSFEESEGTCIGIKVCSGDADCTGQDQFCNILKGVCETKGSLGDECIDGETKCMDNLKCGDSQNGVSTCGCRDGYIESIVGGSRGCVLKCTVNIDCKEESEYCSTTTGICSPQLGLNGVCNMADINAETNPCKTPLASCQGDENLAYCLCDTDYIQDGTSCIAKCKANADCQSDQKFCNLITGACLAKVNLHEQCLPQEEGADQCLIGNSECKPGPEGLNNTECICSDGYLERNGARCDPICKLSSDCSGSNEYCETDTGYCSSKVELNQGCSYPDQCSTANAECSETESKCLCKIAFVELSGQCRDDCRVTTGICKVNEYCKADSGLCNKKVELNSPCEDDTQCLLDTAVCKGSEASPDAKTCKCTDGYFEESKACLETCTKTSACDFTVQYCDELFGKCRDKVGLHQQCTKEGDEQCLGDLALCTGKECLCKQEAVDSLDKKRCLLVKRFIKHCLRYNIAYRRLTVRFTDIFYLTCRLQALSETSVKSLSSARTRP